MHSKRPIIGMNAYELGLFCKEHGYRAFHGSQLFGWLYNRYATSFSEMTDLPAALRSELSQSFSLSSLEEKQKRVSSRKDAVKYSFEAASGNQFEAVVLINSKGKLSFCISSQIGCPVGCSFCATGSMGFVRNLSADEIILEVLSLTRLHGRPFSILFMGMGEPLLNIEEVIRSIDIFTAMGISSRHITVSTCGIVEGIYRLAETGLRPRLAVSAGALSDEKRQTLIPLSRKNPLSSLKEAILYYRKKTGRRVSIEYTIIRDVNDTDEDAYALARYTRSTRSHINLIRYNRTEKSNYLPPDTKRVDHFKHILKREGVLVSERYRRGDDISASCGQLTTQIHRDS